MLHELLDQLSREEQALNLEKIRARIAASIACHAAIRFTSSATHKQERTLSSVLWPI